jgi:hypothetical protein
MLSAPGLTAGEEGKGQESSDWTTADAWARYAKLYFESTKNFLRMAIER